MWAPSDDHTGAEPADDRVLWPSENHALWKPRATPCGPDPTNSRKRRLTRQVTPM